MSSETAVYTHGHHESVLRSHTWRTIANSAAYLEEHLHPGASLLDIGCGPGTITAEFARRLAPGRVVGLDADPGIVETAAAEQRADGLEFVVGDAAALDFPDASFDIVHAHQVLQHLADPIGVLREMRRVAKPGGIVAVRDADYSGKFWFPAFSGLSEWLDLYERVSRGNGGEPNAGRRLLAWARRAGFEDVHLSSSSWCFSSDEDRAWWGELWAERSLHSGFAEGALKAGYATRAELEHISEAWRAWAVDPDGLVVIPHVELIARA